MKKNLAKSLVCIMLLTAFCFALTACGGNSASAGNDTWRKDGQFGGASYENQHTFFIKTSDTDAVVMSYTTNSQDKAKITASASFNCTYTQDGNQVKVTVVSGCVHAMNGDNPIDQIFEGEQSETWWANMVASGVDTFTLADDGTFSWE